MGDIYQLERFVEAQQSVWEQVRSELAAGSKRGHWMWFIFPQIAGLGNSATAQRYAISGIAEAQAYLAHSVLGPRLRESTELVNQVQDRSPGQIFGSPDDLKFRSSMTLFSRATQDNRIFLDALDKYFGGQPDRLTLERLL